MKKTAHNGAVDSFLYVLGAVLVIGILRPLVWWVALGASLWLGRKLLSPKWGKIVFGRYWV